MTARPLARTEPNHLVCGGAMVYANALAQMREGVMLGLAEVLAGSGVERVLLRRGGDGWGVEDFYRAGDGNALTRSPAADGGAADTVLYDRLRAYVRDISEVLDVPVLDLVFAGDLHAANAPMGYPMVVVAPAG